MECVGDKTVTIGYQICLRDSNGEYVVKSAKCDPRQKFTKVHNCWGWNDTTKRKHILEPSNQILDNGVLTIELRMNLVETNECRNFAPSNPIINNMLKLLDDEESADVTFELDEPRSSNARPDKIHFHAHQLILKACAPDLAALCETYDKSTPVPISDVKPEIFRHLLRYAYGGTIPAELLDENAQEFIDAADKYEVINLKLEAEARYVEQCKITMENVVELLNYADGEKCALLKEVALEFALDHANELIESDSFANMPNSQSVMAELFAVIAQKGVKGSADETKTMSINSLRKRLHDEGLDVDGSRDMLIDRLHQHLKKQKS